MAKRRVRPEPRWQQRMAGAQTPEERLTVTCDRLRASLKHLHRPRRDRAVRAAAEGMASRLATQANDYLTRLCEEIERAERSDAA
jgi:hypothetical protein